MHNDPNIKGASVKAEEEFKRQYPAVYNYLEGHKEKLSKRNKAETGIRYEWYALQRWGSNYSDEFYKQKIMYNDINRRLSFCLVDKGIFCNNTIYFISTEIHQNYFLAILNSKLINWYYKTLSVQLGEKAVRMFTIYVNKIPIPKINSQKEKEISILVDEFLKSFNPEIDSKLDTLIFDLYNLTKEEIEYIKINF